MVEILKRKVRLIHLLDEFETIVNEGILCETLYFIGEEVCLELARVHRLIADTEDFELANAIKLEDLRAQKLFDILEDLERQEGVTE